MKKLKLAKVIASTLVVASILALNPIGVSAEWRQDSNGWWYTEGNSWATGWRNIDGSWYYFYSNGYMAKDTYVGNYYVNHNGVWVQDNKKNQISTSNDANTSSETSTHSQGISVTYPSNWTKMGETDGGTNYNLNNEGAVVRVNSINMQGHSQQDFLQGNLAVLKSTFNTEYKVSNQLINGKTADVIDYVYSTGGQTMLMHDVLLYNNGTAYLFMLIQSNPTSSSNLDSFNRMLDTVKFK